MTELDPGAHEEMKAKRAREEAAAAARLTATPAEGTPLREYAVHTYSDLVPAQKLLLIVSSPQSNAARAARSMLRIRSL